MQENTTDALLRQVVDVLRENQRLNAEYRKVVVGDAEKSLRPRTDWAKEREEAARRMAEATDRAEKRRVEDVEHRGAMLAELKSITALLRRLVGEQSGRAG